MWDSHFDQIDEKTTMGTLKNGARVLSFREVAQLWETNAEFRKWFSGVLCQCPFKTFFWETPPVTEDTFGRPFEFVLIEGGPLALLKPDPSPFQSHFAARPGEEVLAFPNLGRDALLVVPAPILDESCYTHLAQFLRNAPGGQVDTLWRRVGAAINSRISIPRTWLNTSGMGVPWLHVRLDSRPKYYRYGPYKDGR
jgi:hypothetical protein